MAKKVLNQMKQSVGQMAPGTNMNNIGTKKIPKAVKGNTKDRVRGNLEATNNSGLSRGTNPTSMPKPAPAKVSATVETGKKMPGANLAKSANNAGTKMPWPSVAKTGKKTVPSTVGKLTKDLSGMSLDGTTMPPPSPAKTIKKAKSTKKSKSGKAGFKAPMPGKGQMGMDA